MHPPIFSMIRQLDVLFILSLVTKQCSSKGAATRGAAAGTVEFISRVHFIYFTMNEIQLLRILSYSFSFVLFFLININIIIFFSGGGAGVTVGEGGSGQYTEQEMEAALIILCMVLLLFFLICASQCFQVSK